MESSVSVIRSGSPSFATAIQSSVHVHDEVPVSRSPPWNEKSVRGERGKVTIPVGISIFPGEIFSPSRRWAEMGFDNIAYWNEPPRGGHFAAFEQPALFVEEMRNCFRQFR